MHQNDTPLPDALPELSWFPDTREIQLGLDGTAILRGCVTVLDRQGSELPEALVRISSAVEVQMPEAVFLGYPGMHRYSGDIPAGLEARSLVVRICPLVYGQDALLTADVQAGSGSFAATAAGPDPVVRSSTNASQSLLNTGVFNPESDWMLEAAGDCEVQVTTVAAGVHQITARGGEITLRFFARFFRTHRGFYRHNPTAGVWQDPVSGWCSWAAHLGEVTQEHILAAARLFATELKAYGWNIIQMDDGYQRLKQSDPKPLEPGERVSDLWAIPNEKFPNGLDWLAGEIIALGLVPGIWISITTPQGLPDDYYVKGPDGSPSRERFSGYAIDGTNTQAVDEVFGEVIHRWKDQGWRYFKIDTLRHLLYDHYRQQPGYWEARGIGPDEAFRQFFSRLKEAAGPDVYVLACWGVLPELAGIADGCRIGEDVGAHLDSMLRAARYISRFQYTNNIVWRNDPDYMCMRVPADQARTWASLLALTGSQLMVSDPAESYDAERLEIMRRVGPPVFVHPTTLRQLPEDSMWWLLEVDCPFEHWTVAARVAWDEAGLPAGFCRFAQLGLRADTPYLVFDFWNQRFTGVHTGEFPVTELRQGQCQTLGFREAAGHPQVLATSRHITMGAVELEDVCWDGKALSGWFKVPDTRPQTLYIYLPEGWNPVQSSHPYTTEGQVLRLEISAPTGRVPWEVVCAG